MKMKQYFERVMASLSILRGLFSAISICGVFLILSNMSDMLPSIDSKKPLKTFKIELSGNANASRTNQILSEIKVSAKKVFSEEMSGVEISDSSENILPPGCNYAKDEIDITKSYDLCIVGAGLSGTVFAERTSELEESVLVIDSRTHIGGNCYDYVDQKTGVLRNQYGSLLFHTKIEEVWNYINNPRSPVLKQWYHQKFRTGNGA